MRAVTKAVIAAFLDGRSRSVRNTSTDGRTIFLHGHAIIRRDGSGGFEFSLAGWNTVLTRERINGFLDMIGSPCAVRQTSFKPFFGSHAAGWRGIDSKEWITVPDFRSRLAA